MKFKFRADPKDWVIFGVFCLILLYLVSIVVVNINSLAVTGLLSGLNPFPAFTPKFILATLVGFVGSLIAIGAGVSTYFFDREKGFGISTDGKKEKGYSRWLQDREMKKELERVYPTERACNVAGIPLINNGKELWVDNSEFHNLIIGSTGSGKTEMLVQPMVKILAKAGESMIITDPKGEIYENNAEELREKGYNVVLLNFRNPRNGNSWNPMELPYKLYQKGNKDKANELLDDLAANILYDEKAQNQDPFWEKTSADYFAGLGLALFEDAKPDEINLNSINLMTTVGEDKCGHSTYIKEYFSFKNPASPAYINVASTIMAPSDTKSSILSVFKQKIKLFSSRENLSEMLSHSDFDMEDIGKKKTAVFIVVQDEKKTYHSLVTIFIKQCYETLIDVAQQSGGKLPYRTNFILDEFPNMPPLKDVTTMVTAARSRLIRFSFIIQSFSQLSKVYGKDDAETIKGNCGNIIYLISSELAALEEISKMCGEVKSKEKDKTASTPLVTVSDLQRLPKWSIIVLRLRKMPYKTKLTPNWQMEKDNAWGDKYPKAGYPTREEQEIHLFDIKGFVDSRKDEKLNQIMSNLNNKPQPQQQNPFMGGIDMNQFFKNVDAKLAQLDKEEKEKKSEKDTTVAQFNPFNSKDVKKEEPKFESFLPKDEEKINKEVEKPVRRKEEMFNPFEKKEDVQIHNPFEEIKPKSTIDNKPKSSFLYEDEKKLHETIDKPIVKDVKVVEKPVVKEEKHETYKEKSDNTKNGITDDQFFDDFFNDE